MSRNLIIVVIILSLFVFDTSYSQTLQQSISLKAGFNFISFTLKPDATAAGLKGQNASINDIYSYSASAGSFISASEGTLTTLNIGRGYIINAKADGAVTVTGAAVPAIGNVALKAGFNLVGFSKISENIKFTGLMQRSQLISGIYKWSLASGSFITVLKGGNLLDGIDPAVTQAQAYFIDLTGDTAINFDGNAITIGTQPPAGQSISIDLGGAAVEMVKIPSGTFQMGGPESEAGRDLNEGPVHAVTLTKNFYLGKFEVTQGQWKAVMGSNSSKFVNGDNYPVEGVSWNDCQAFISKMNTHYGSYGTFRLPTESEWEYSCRAGTTTPYYWGQTVDGKYCMYLSISGNTTRKVGNDPASSNAFGLFDMSGNVWEWCSDWFGSYQAASVVDPQGANSGSYHLLRGGSWRADAAKCRSAYRGHGHPSDLSQVGFRLALSPAGQ